MDKQKGGIFIQILKAFWNFEYWIFYSHTQLYRPEDDAVSKSLICSTNMKDRTAQKHMQ